MLRSIDPGTQNMAVVDVCLHTGRLLRWWVLGGMTGVNACRKLCDHLVDLEPRFPSEVIIERQSKKSGVMLAVQCWAQAWYVGRGVRVHPVPAQMKSDVLGGKFANYRDRKKAAVVVAGARIPPELRPRWCALKKKDDPADGACQAWAWLQSRRRVPLPAGDTSSGAMGSTR